MTDAAALTVCFTIQAMSRYIARNTLYRFFLRSYTGCDWNVKNARTCAGHSATRAFVLRHQGLLGKHISDSWSIPTGWCAPMLLSWHNYTIDQYQFAHTYMNSILTNNMQTSKISFATVCILELKDNGVNTVGQ